MFCSNCGAQIPENIRFCTNCGAAVSGAEPDLPEGITQDENGAYHWVYRLDMLRNPVPLYTVFKIFFCIVTGIAVFLFLLTLSEGDGFLAAARMFAIMFFGFNGLFFVLGLIAWGIMSITRKAHYVIEHMMDEDMVAFVQTEEESLRSKQLGVLTMAAGGLSSVGLGLNLATRGDAFISRYCDVKAVIARRRMDLIKVNGTLQRNQIYAYPHQYAFVWNYLTSHCPNANIRG